MEEELEEFRKQWRAEVVLAKNKAAANDITHLTPSAVNATSNKYSKPEDKDSLTEQNLSNTKPEDRSAVENSENASERAIKLYSAGVIKEKEGNLSQALINYRLAFKLDSNVMESYRENIALHEAQHNDDDSFVRPIHTGNDYDPNMNSKFEKTSVDELVNQFQDMEIDFVPENTNKQILLRRLPNELILYIMKHLIIEDFRSVLQLSLTCKKFLLLTRSQSLWRYLCEHTYRNPSLSKRANSLLQEDYLELYQRNWLRMYIERPRVRTEDGIYISVCNYIRPGSSDNAWYQPIHLVTYFRFLRFFSDFSCISLCSSEEPKEVVRTFHPLMKYKKGLMHGFYRIEGEIVNVTLKESTRPNDTFYVTLKLRSTHRGKHNKLAWIEYYSIDSRRNDKVEYSLKQMKPYLFRRYPLPPPPTSSVSSHP
ncbi:uncharacterized protein VTP21DRAFT_5455 [Calcarisporiella thermophila]|uniref:uncharacterized protein n=1 Tax=Calcarisporiella thermophila TaxID=911321 RepID=UPI003742FB75